MPGVAVSVPTDLVARYRAVDREEIGSALVDTPAHLDALTESIGLVGIRVPLQLTFNREFGALDGNHRIAAAIRLGLLAVPVVLLQVPARPRPDHGQPMCPDDFIELDALASRENTAGGR